MPRSQIITAIDIGTASFKILTVAKESEDSSFEVLCQIEEPSAGIRRGVVIDPAEVSQRIRQLVERARAQTGEKIDSVYINLGGSHTSVKPSHGEIAVSRADQKISQEDVERAIQAAETFSLPYNKEIIDVFPKEFIVDGQKGIRDAPGMIGVKLEAEILAICAFSPFLKNLTKAVLDANIHIADISPSFLASARSALSPEEKELGSAVLDIGAGTSDLAVFEEKNLVHAAVFPIGSSHITNDLAIGLCSDIDIAERVKKEFGICYCPKTPSRDLASKIHTIDISSSAEPLVFNQKQLMTIIEPRVSEILELADLELKSISRNSLLPAGIIITGGGAKIPGVVELAKKKLKLPARIGRIKEKFTGLDKEVFFSTACGLVLRAFDTHQTSAKPWNTQVFKKVKKIFKVFVP